MMMMMVHLPLIADIPYVIMHYRAIALLVGLARKDPETSPFSSLFDLVTLFSWRASKM